MVVSRQFDYLKTSKNDLQCQRTSQFIKNLGLINVSDETQECESLRLSHGRWIGD